MAKGPTLSEKQTKAESQLGVGWLSGYRLSRWLMVVAVVFFAGYHAPHLTEPPSGYHEWREALTASVSLCYYQESMNFLEPRIHYRGATSGVNGMEFPIFSYVTALIYTVLGPEHLWARLVIFLTALGTLLMLYKLLRMWFDTPRGACGVFCLVMSPLFLFYGSKIMPDTSVLLPLMAAVYAFGRWYTTGKARYWWISAVCLAVAASIKPPCLTVYLPLAYASYLKERRWGVALRQFSAYVVVTMLPVIAWVTYARALAAQNPMGAFFLGQEFSDVWAALKSGWFIKTNVLQRPWEMWVGWGLVPAFLFGLDGARRHAEGRFLLLWALSCFMGLVVMAEHSAMHEYDATLITLPLAGITGLGLYRLMTLPSRWRWLAALLIVAGPVYAYGRVCHRYSSPPFEQIRAEAAIIKPTELVIAEDSSPIIRLYQLNRYGWATRDNVTPEWIEQAVRAGASWFVLERPLPQQRFDLTKYVSDTIPVHIGPLLAYRIQQQH